MVASTTVPCARATSRRCVAGLLSSCGLRPEQSRSNPAPTGRTAQRSPSSHSLCPPTTSRQSKSGTVLARRTRDPCWSPSSPCRHAARGPHRRCQVRQIRGEPTARVPQRRDSAQRPNGARTPDLAEVVAASASMFCGGTARWPRAAGSPLSNAAQRTRQGAGASLTLLASCRGCSLRANSVPRSVWLIRPRRARTPKGDRPSARRESQFRP